MMIMAICSDVKIYVHFMNEEQVQPVMGTS